MNLHEECLLKYLQNPDELAGATEVLKFTNFIMEQRFILNNFVAKSDVIRYTGEYV